jgi:hypothetical protein
MVPFVRFPKSLLWPLRDDGDQPVEHQALIGSIRHWVPARTIHRRASKTARMSWRRVGRH